MDTKKRLTLGLLLVTLAASAAAAQERASAQAQDRAAAQERPDTSQPPAAPTVTISATERGLRYAALGPVRQLRLEVYGADGEPLYSSGFRAGSVRDWALEDSRGQRLSDGPYLCVVTVRELSGRLSVRQGSVLIQGGRVSLQLGEAAQAASQGADAAPSAVGPSAPASAADSARSLSAVSGGAAPAVTLTAHDGSIGQVVSTRGGLSFRSGDFFSGRDKELMRLTPEGNLGLGVSDPQARLDVAGTIRARGGILFDDGSVLRSASGAGAVRLTPGPTLAGVTQSAGVTPSAVSGTGTTGRLVKWTNGGTGALGDSVVTESAGGNIGVGTAAPNSKLHVVGSLELGAASGSGVDPTLLNPNTLAGFSQLRFYPSSGTNVNMSFAVVPRGAGASLNRAQFSISNTDSVADSANVEFASLRARGPDFVFGTGSTGTGVNRPIMFAAGFLRDNATNNGQFYLATNGNVGVGTTNPQARLDVNGSLSVSGNIAAKYQDVAEWVEASGDVRAGTVVVLDAKRGNAVEPSARAYDTRVAGVVSAQPGVVLGEAGEGKALVATTGRVRVRVDARRRPIRVGDLLVTGGGEGVAMRSVPVKAGRALMHRPGTIIGKALEPLAAGRGEILVLLSLQ